MNRCIYLINGLCYGTEKPCTDPEHCPNSIEPKIQMKKQSNYKYIDFTGKKINRLLVIKPTNNRSPRGNIIWECKCDCGKIVYLHSGKLSSKQTISCGCYRTEILRKNAKPKNPIGITPANRLYYNYKQNAKLRYLDFSLTFDEFIKLISKPCYYCGEEHYIKTVNIRFREDYILHNGLDRIDNMKGYTINNVVPCCSICNYARRDLTQQDFKNWVKKIYLNLFK
jgi:hypothetical protein